MLTTGVALALGSAEAAGLLKPINAANELEIKTHEVTVTIEDGYAITQVDQSFYNAGSVPLEAIYSFPVPQNGTVAEFSIWIDENRVVGEVVEKQKAREIYETERDQGNQAGLTEKVEFYRFETAVSPVLPQQDTKIRLVYLQPADVEGGIGRYVYPLEDGGTDEAKNSFWQVDDTVNTDFSFNLALRSGFPIDAVRSPAHPNAIIHQLDAQNWQVDIGQTGQSVSAQPNPSQDRSAAFADAAPAASAQSSTLNQDIVLYWRLAPNQPGAINVVAHKSPGARQGTFMLTVTPGIDLAPITEGRDWVFLLDRSGSMSGKYGTLLDATSQALSHLGPKDRFQILLFDEHIQSVTNGWETVTQAGISATVNALNQTQPEGGTNLYLGLQSAMDALDRDRTSGIVLVTDGVANVGKRERADFLDLMQQHDVRLFTAIMGNGANEPLLSEMAQVSNGFSQSISNSDDIMGILLSALNKVNYQALHNVELRINGIKTSDLTPEQPTTLYRGEQMVIFGHYYGSDDAEIVLNAKVSGQAHSFQTRYHFPDTATRNPEIERLWAYAKIQGLQNKADYLGVDRADFEGAIVDLATEYGLVTDFTSMVVMPEERFAQYGIEQKNAERRQLEEAASAQRAAAPVANHRVDQSQPAFQQSQPIYRSSSSGGALGLPALMALIVLIVYRRRVD
ncbi:MAG: VWA domain-containing protein [Gammaproteobacteria bacterium]|nr:VWA domain-containing protein [Gammaproteobacteria bacterium]